MKIQSEKLFPTSTTEGLHSEALAAYEAANADYLKSEGHIHDRIPITSGYRSIAKQAELYDGYIRYKKGIDTTEVFPADPPGISTHNYGVAIDVVWRQDPTRIADALTSNHWQRTHANEQHHFDCTGMASWSTIEAKIGEITPLSVAWRDTLNAKYDLQIESSKLKPELAERATALEKEADRLTELEVSLTRTAAALEQQARQLERTAEFVETEQQDLRLLRSKIDSWFANYRLCDQGLPYNECTHHDRKRCYKAEYDSMVEEHNRRAASLRAIIQAFNRDRTQYEDRRNDYLADKRQFVKDKDAFRVSKDAWEKDSRYLSEIARNIRAKEEQLPVLLNRIYQAFNGFFSKNASAERETSFERIGISEDVRASEIPRFIAVWPADTVVTESWPHTIFLCKDPEITSAVITVELQRMSEFGEWTSVQVRNSNRPRPFRSNGKEFYFHGMALCEPRYTAGEREQELLKQDFERCKEAQRRGEHTRVCHHYNFGYISYLPLRDSDYRWRAILAHDKGTDYTEWKHFTTGAPIDDSFNGTGSNWSSFGGNWRFDGRCSVEGDSNRRFWFTLNNSMGQARPPNSRQSLLTGAEYIFTSQFDLSAHDEDSCYASFLFPCRIVEDYGEKMLAGIEVRTFGSRNIEVLLRAPNPYIPSLSLLAPTKCNALTSFGGNKIEIAIKNRWGVFPGQGLLYGGMGTFGIRIRINDSLFWCSPRRPQIPWASYFPDFGANKLTCGIGFSSTSDNDRLDVTSVLVDRWRIPESHRADSTSCAKQEDGWAIDDTGL